MIDILMALYNGERYLAEQLDSILNQSITEWRLVLVDDCSKDRTPEIAREYAERYPGKITFYRRENNLGSAQKSFFDMLQYSSAEYVMTSDQDDYWLADKLKVTLEKMKEIEAEHGSDVPLLVHTDLRVVDAELHTIHESMFRAQNLDSRRDALPQLLAQNIVSGCTEMFNRALVDTITKIPQHAVMHDWWYALVAGAFGAVGFVNQPTILYRQHGGNEVGAKDVRSVQYNVERANDPVGARRSLILTYRQAAEFLELYGERLGPREKELVNAYAGLRSAGKWKKICTLFRYGFWKKGLFRKLGQIVFC